MAILDHFTSIRFRNYKAFKEYSVSLKEFNVLVGPNNSGKSTIIGAFRILSEGIRKASARKPEYIHSQQQDFWGYRINLENLPVATENIFTNYDDSEPANVKFRLSSGNKLILHFPAVNECYLICETTTRPVRTPSDFKKYFHSTLGFVPILGPVEHNEPLYNKEAARLALLTHRASRNFRNIWYHFPEDFQEFRALIRSTWPGMDIQQPEVHIKQGPTPLHMFCPEERYPRELFWAGFGFQVWCQMLTYIVRSKMDALFIIDEPDIYLHSDLQRQIVGILKSLGPDILIATHSTEIISECDPDDLLIVNKNFKSAKRIKDPSQLQSVFNVLGSNLNPTLTQLAKTKKAVFVEGKDFQIFSAFARKLGMNHVANRSDFAVIPVEGFDSKKVRDFSRGMELTLGTPIIKAVIFDKDYRSNEEVKDTIKDLKKYCSIAFIHKRKEVENYLLECSAIEKAINTKINEKNKRTDANVIFDKNVNKLFTTITDALKHDVQGQFLSKRMQYKKRESPNLDQSTISSQILSEFDSLWNTFSERMNLVPGKQVLSLLNKYLQENYGVTISVTVIITSFNRKEVPEDIVELIHALDNLRKEKI